MTSGLHVRFVVDPSDPSPPWSLSRLRSSLTALGHVVDVRSTAGDLVGVDLVHAFGSRAGAHARTLCAGRVPWVLSLREGSADDRIDSEELCRVAVDADALLIRSSALEDRLTRAGVSRARSVVLPVGVDTETFHRRGPMANRTQRTRLIVEIAHQRTASNEAWEAVLQNEDVELVALGSRDQTDALGHDAAALLERADVLGVRDRVMIAWYGEPLEKAWWLRSAHAVLALSAAPGRADFVAEAMACGVAVIATPVEAQRDLVVHGITGLLVAERDPAAALRAVRDVVRDEFQVEALGLAGADRALGRLAWDRVAVELASAYQRVVSRAVVGSLTDDSEDDELEQTG
jgi:glycosyltransferase involved in cell wall biosynthesis